MSTRSRVHRFSRESLVVWCIFICCGSARGACLDPASGLVAWWPADGSAQEVVGGLNGTLANGAGFLQGEFGLAFRLNGANEYVDNAVTGLTNLADTYSMEFWAWPTRERQTSYEELFGQSIGENQQRYAIRPNIDNSGRVGSGVSVGTNGVSVWEAGNFDRDVHNYSLLVYDAPISGWTHIAVVYVSRQPSLYVNGALVRTGLSSLHSSYPSTVFGANHLSFWTYYAGLLDEIAYYNRALSAAEITSIYTNSSGIAGKCQIAAPYTRLAKSNSTVLVAWPLWADGYQLQETSKLVPASEWTNSSLAPITNGSERQVSAPLEPERKFYRLHRQ